MASTKEYSAISGLAYYLDIIHSFQQHFDTVSHQGMIVNNNYANHNNENERIGAAGEYRESRKEVLAVYEAIQSLVVNVRY